MPTVRVEPKAFEFEAVSGETVMGAALRCGYRWPTVCGGQGNCTTCYVVVVSGGDHLQPIGPVEQMALPPLLNRHSGAAPGTVRLACQAVVAGDVTVFKRSVRTYEP